MTAATPAVQALVDAFMAMPAALRRKALAGLSPAELTDLAYHWPLWARADQLPPEGCWRTWLLLAGRGAGKTRAAAEFINGEVRAGRHVAIALVSPTNETARRDQVAAIVSCSPPDFMATYEPAQRRVVWPNGAVAFIVTAEEPDRARGLNISLAWGDELTSWSFADDTWSNVQLALRIPGPMGDAPRALVTTTPKRHALLRAILADPATVVTRARTIDNAANLAPEALAALRARYDGTSLGRQELDGEHLDEVDGALWSRDLLEASRVPAGVNRQMRRVVVAIDPAGGAGRGSTETGIVVAGVGQDGHGYVLADRSGKHSPERWAYSAVAAYNDHNADRIVAERNFGGEMVEATIRTAAPNVPVRMVHASRGKMLRAEPVVALFEQGRVHLVGTFATLEDQLCSWDPMGAGPSPDRLDALVWAITDLMLGEAAPQPARWAPSFHMAR
jgi:phage terminase large subunit-like protein